MTFKPTHGWGDEQPRQPDQILVPQQQQYPAAQQSANYYNPYQARRRRYGLTCQVCQQGTLTAKNVYRMSGPVVLIGYILLIPSVIGMVCALLIIIGILGFSGAMATAPIVASQLSPKASQAELNVAAFRRSCVINAQRGYRRTTGELYPLRAFETYCECALNVYQRQGSTEGVVQQCSSQALLASDDSVHEEYVDALNHRSTQQLPKTAGVIAAGVVGGTLAATIGIGFGVAVLIIAFVGGLLGWLLVMKKKVLQCSLCQATVSAS